MGIIINEPFIVGQRNALEWLETLLTNAEANPPFSRIGVAGLGGSGKTLLLKALFNSQKVRNLFTDGLFIWLTVSQTPSIPSLQNELKTQIAMQTEADHTININNITLNESMQGKKFVMFLDDVWDHGVEFLEELGVLRVIDHPPTLQNYCEFQKLQCALADGSCKGVHNHNGEFE